MLKMEERKREYSFNFDINKDNEQITFDDILDCWSPNRRYFNNLINLVNNNNLVPLIGAGLTKNLANGSFPSWKELLLKLANMENMGENEIEKIKLLINCSKDTDSNYEKAAQILEDINGVSLFQKDLREVFSARKLNNEKIKNSALMLLPKLHPQIILTTNYDSAIERAYYLSRNYSDSNDDAVRAREIESIKVLTPCTSTREFVNLIKNRLTESTAKPILYKFHGDVQDNGSTHDLILSEKSYNAIYGTKAEVRKKCMNKDVIKNLYMFLFAKTILFIGCSLEQDRIMDLISVNTEVEHYAFVGCGNSNKEKFSIDDANRDAMERSKKLNDMNIHAIFYPRYARNCVNILLENLANTNTSLNVSSMYPKKSEWMNRYFSKLSENKLENDIVIFGGIITDLRKRNSSNLKLLNKCLDDNPTVNIYFCYDSENAAQHRSNQIRSGISKNNTKEKIAQIQCIPEQFSIENRSRVKIIPILYDLNGYAVLANNELFWNFLTHERSSGTPVVKLDLEYGENIKFINYMKYALEQSKILINKIISKSYDIDKILETEDPVLVSTEESKKKLQYIDELIQILDSYIK